MSSCAKIRSWAPMARAHAEKRAQRDQAGSRDEKKTKAIPSSSASRKLMPVDQAMRQTCQGHITSRMKSRRTNMEEAPPHCIMQKREVENPHCSSRWRPLSQLSPLLPRESETHKRLVCICVLGKYIPLVSTVPYGYDRCVFNTSDGLVSISRPPWFDRSYDRSFDFQYLDLR